MDTDIGFQPSLGKVITCIILNFLTTLFLDSSGLFFFNRYANRKFMQLMETVGFLPLSENLTLDHLQTWCIYSVIKYSGMTWFEAALFQ